MAKGTIKFFNTDKGYGFITTEDGKDLFFHISNLEGDNANQGDSVDFEVGEGRKGPCAVDVKVV